MIYHKNFHFHYLEIPSIYHLLSSILFYHYFMQKSITLLLHFLYIYITSPKKWKFFWKKLEIQFPIYGNKIGNIWKRNWKKLETLLGKTGNFQFFPIRKRKSVRGAEQRNKPSVFYARSCENGGTNN